MDTDVREFQAALNTLKQASAPFAALTKLYDAAEPLLTVLSHEAELRKSIDACKAEIAALKEQAAAARAVEETAMADAKVEHEKYVAEYAAHRDKLRSEALAVEAERDQRIAKAQADVVKCDDDLKAEITDRQTAAAAERQKITDNLIAFQKSAGAEQAKITAQTVALQAHLDELKGKVSAALA